MSLGRCWGRSRARRFTTSLLTRTERTSSCSSAICSSSRWTMTRWEGSPILLIWPHLFPLQYHYTFTSFDVETLDLEDFKYNHVNITAFRLAVWWNSFHFSLSTYSFWINRFVDAENYMVKELLTEMEEFSPVGSNILNKSGVSNTLHFNHYPIISLTSW